MIGQAWNQMNYFAYGSNMAVDRLQERVSSVRLIGVYRLASHVLRFHKIGKDGSAKCDAFFTGSRSDVIEGVAFEIDRADVEVLDRIEGRGYGYETKTVRVTDADGDLEAFTYVATDIDEALHPFTWYKNHVLVGATKAGLSHGYVAWIEGVKAVRDPDQTREKRELAIHDG